MKFQENTFSPAPSSILTWDTRAVEPKPSAGIVSLTMVEEKVDLAKFTAASLDSMARMNSLPPATFLPCDGTMKPSPAVECSASQGSAESLDTTGSGAPVILKPSLVCFFISFSIQPPEG